jgi:2-keto-4-pentenoate hydratase
MTIATSERARAAASLREAEGTRRPIEPLVRTWPQLNVADAYAIQLLNIAARVEAGGIVRGHKVGLSSTAMQSMLGVHEPDYGHLLHDMFCFDGDVVPVERFIQPRAEIEMAFVLGRDLAGPGVTIADVVRATDHVLPAIEVVDSRIRDWQLTIADTIADNASSGALVLGGRPTLLRQIDPVLVGAAMSVNGCIVETGCTGAVLGNPMTAVAWLANRVAEFGVVLEEGHVVLPGSCTRMVPVAAGDAVRADFHGMGHVSLRFV